jgi:hypothetical protein
MKKIVLSLAGVLAATAFAPEAAAIPAFARQTGMACSACHQQHYPVLNAFGRAYKAGGYTMMGAQGKVEGDHLSIPDTLNLSMLLKLRYVDSGGASGAGKNAGTGAGVDKANGQWQFGDELVMLGGGRVAENAGWFGEISLHGTTGTGATAAILRLPFAYDMGSVKLSIVPFSTDAGGAHVGYEQSSAGILRANRWSEQRRDVSAVQYTLADGNGSNANWAGAATGFAFAAQNDMGYIAWTRFSPNHLLGGAGQAIPSFDMSSNLFRLAITPSYNDWAFHAGVGVMTGTSEVATAIAGATNGAMLDARGHFFDAQAHGKLGGKDIGFYGTYAKAPVVSGNCTGAIAATATNQAGGCNLFNNGTLDKWSWTVGVDYSIIPHTLHIGAAYRDARTGAQQAVTLANVTDKSTLVQAVYDLTQNVALHAIYSSRSGSKYGPTTQGQNETMFMLESAW